MQHDRHLTYLPDRPRNMEWLAQVFSARSVQRGGVLKRQIGDVEREIGADLLELEVRRRGIHLIRTRTHFLIVCDSGPIHVIC